MRRAMIFKSNTGNHDKKERGAAEIVQTLFMLPLVLVLIFAMIDIGFFFSARTTVQNMTRDAARQVAMAGGVDTRLSTYDIEAALSKSIYDPAKGKCSYIGCSGPPSKVDCYVINSNGKKANQAREAGQDVACEVTYKYTPISFFNNGVLFSKGKGDFLSRNYTLIEHARSETGFQ